MCVFLDYFIIIKKFWYKKGVPNTYTTFSPLWFKTFYFFTKKKNSLALQPNPYIQKNNDVMFDYIFYI